MKQKLFCIMRDTRESYTYYNNKFLEVYHKVCFLLHDQIGQKVICVSLSLYLFYDRWKVVAAVTPRPQSAISRGIWLDEEGQSAVADCCMLASDALHPLSERRDGIFQPEPDATSALDEWTFLRELRSLTNRTEGYRGLVRTHGCVVLRLPFILIKQPEVIKPLLGKLIPRNYWAAERITIYRTRRQTLRTKSPRARCSPPTPSARPSASQRSNSSRRLGNLVKYRTASVGTLWLWFGISSKIRNKAPLCVI